MHDLMNDTKILLDVLRTLNELGSFSYVTDGVIFHNTLILQTMVFGPAAVLNLGQTILGYSCGIA